MERNGFETQLCYTFCLIGLIADRPPGRAVCVPGFVGSPAFRSESRAVPGVQDRPGAASGREKDPMTQSCFGEEGTA